MASIQRNRRVVLWIFVALFFYACGGGGGDGNAVPSTANTTDNDNGGTSTTSDTTTPADTEVASAATKAAVNAMIFFDVTRLGFTKPALEVTRVENDAQRLRDGVSALYAYLGQHGERQKGRYAVTSEAEDCDSGGGLYSEDNRDTDNLFDDIITESFTDCLKGGEILQNGTNITTYSTTENGENQVTVTYDNLEESILNATGIPMRYRRVDGTVAIISGGLKECPTTYEVIPDGNIEVRMNIVIEDKTDEDGNNILEYNEVFTMTDVVMTIQETRDVNCLEEKTEIGIVGKMKVDDLLEPDGDDNFTATFEAFNITSTPITTGNYLEFSGNVSITGICVNGTYTVGTSEPIFYPNDSSICPVKGELTITGGGGTVALISTVHGGLQVDEGNDGTIDAEFQTCQESAFCSNQ